MSDVDRIAHGLLQALDRATLLPLPTRTEPGFDLARAFAVAGAGWLLNVVPMALNDGMPVSRAAQEAVGLVRGLPYASQVLLSIVPIGLTAIALSLLALLAWALLRVDRGGPHGKSLKRGIGTADSSGSFTATPSPRKRSGGTKVA